MSYILDALRRADAERERDKGAVPGLHARPLATPAEEPAAAAPRPGLLLAALGVSLGLLVALAGWILLRDDVPAGPGAAPASAVQPAAAPGQIPPAAAPPVAAGARMATPPTAPGPAERTAAEPLLAAPAPATIVQVVPVPVPAPAQAAPPRPQPAAEASPAAAAAVPVPAGPNPAAVPGPAAARPVPLAQLPPELRAQWPALAVGGSVYSDNAASRFVIFNGQIVREGDSPAPGLLVERIGPKSAVLRWRELRVEVPL